MAVKSVDKMIDLLRQSKIVVVADIETTGTGLRVYEDITQISAVKVNLMTKRSIGTFNHYCKLSKRRSVPANVVELTGITDQLLAEQGEPIDDILRAFYAFADGLPVVFHNYVFDWKRWLVPELERIGIVAQNPAMCSLMLSRTLLKNKPDCPEDFKLNTLVEYFGGTMKDAHNSLADCRYTASVLCKLRELAGATQPVLDMGQPENPTEKVFPMETLIIKKLQYWTKFNTERIYVTCNAGSIFYDVQAGKWQVKELFDGSVDLAWFEDIVLRYAQVDTMPLLVDKYRASVIRHEAEARRTKAASVDTKDQPVPTPDPKKPVVTIYADTSYDEAAEKGAWGAVMIYQNHEKQFSGTVDCGSDEVVDLNCLINLFRALKKPSQIMFSMDSRSVVSKLKMGLPYGWRANNWKKSSRLPVENAELWDDLLREMEPHDIAFRNFKGELADVYDAQCAAIAEAALH